MNISNMIAGRFFPTKTNRKHIAVIFAVDILIYLIVSLFVLIKHPSFDNELTARTIILQTILIFGIVMFCRIIAGIYKIRWSCESYAAYGLLIASDVISFGIVCVAEHLLYYMDRIEVITVFLIIVINFLGALLVRMIYKGINNASLKTIVDIPFSPPDISELEINEVEKALRSGWITTGPRTKKLEKTLADYVGVPKCVCLNSQTACGEMSLRILGIGPGDEVITCAYTYTATASVVEHVGAKLVLVDCSMTGNSVELDYIALEKAITEKTKAIIPIDLAGIPCDYDRIYEIVNRKKELFHANNDIQRAMGRIAVIADAAHALGASYHNQMVGAIADFTNFSFHAVKNFTTGEGGAMTWKHIDGIEDEDVYKRAQLYSLHGQSKDALAKTQKGGWEYDIVGPWYKCNMTDIAAAIGLAQFERYPGLLAKRRKIIEKYDKAFKPLGIETLSHYDDTHISSGHLYLTRVPGITAEQRNEIIIKMAERKVTCNVHYKPLPMMTAYKNLGFDIKDYPNAYNRFANEITLPLYTALTDKEVDFIIRQYTEVVKEYI